MKSFLDLTAASSSGMQALGWTLIHFLWEATLVGGLLAAMLAATDRRRSQVRCSLAHAALAAVLLLPLMTLSMLLANEATAVEAFIQNGSRVMIFVSLASPAAGGLDRLNTVLPWLLGCWCVWVVIRATRLAGGWALNRKAVLRADITPPSGIAAALQRFGEHFRIHVPCYVSLQARVPEVIGVFRPVLLLPASALTGLAPFQLEAILAHELAHVARGDHWVNAIERIADVLFGFHPAVRYISRTIRREREFCCDEMAARVTGDRAEYARALLALEESVATPLALAVTGGSLKERIARMLQQPRISSAPMAATVIVLLIASALVASASLRIVPIPAVSTYPSVQAETITVKRPATKPVPAMRTDDKAAVEFPPDSHNKTLGTAIEPVLSAAERALTAAYPALAASERTLIAAQRALAAAQAPLPQPASPAASPQPPAETKPPQPAQPPATPIPPRAGVIRRLQDEDAANADALRNDPTRLTQLLADLFERLRLDTIGGMELLNARLAALLSDANSAGIEERQVEVKRLEGMLKELEARSEAQADLLKAAQAKTLAAQTRGLEVQSALPELAAALAEIDSRRLIEEQSELIKKFDQVKAVYTSRHPEYLRAIKDLEEQAKRIAVAERQVQRLAQQAQVAELSATKQPSDQELARRRRYSQERFGGAETERGRMYMKFGPPDEIEDHPSAGYQRWYYREIPGIGKDISFEFNRDKRPAASSK